MNNKRIVRLDYDPWKDILTVEGIRYSGELMRSVALAPPGEAFQIVQRHADGCLTVENVTAQLRSYGILHRLCREGLARCPVCGMHHLAQNELGECWFAHRFLWVIEGAV